MQLILDTGSGTYQIRSYEAGKIIVNDEIITDNAIIAPETIIVPWQINTLSELQVTHLDAIFTLKPEIVLLGTGIHQQFLKPVLLAEFYNKHIGIEMMNTHAACRTYNVLMAENRRVVAALFLT